MATLKVHIPSALRGYTGRLGEVSASGTTVGGLLRDLERRFPGLRWRVVDEQGRLRPHIRVSVNEAVVPSLEVRLKEGDRVALIMAFSGG